MLATRSYLPINDYGMFQDVYDSLNTLDEEIKSSNHLRIQAEKMREEWIENITHDLKTPLSPIKGYAEVLQEDKEKNEGQNEEQRKQYAAVILKNTVYMESLINDLN